jgi:hypothetical protein
MSKLVNKIPPRIATAAEAAEGRFPYEFCGKSYTTEAAKRPPEPKPYEISAKTYENTAVSCPPSTRPYYFSADSYNFCSASCLASPDWVSTERNSYELLHFSYGPEPVTLLAELFSYGNLEIS